jgi:hypothetical protein
MPNPDMVFRSDSDSARSFKDLEPSEEDDDSAEDNEDKE